VARIINQGELVGEIPSWALEKGEVAGLNPWPSKEKLGFF